MKKIIILVSLLQSGLVLSSNEDTRGTQTFRTIGPGPSCNYDTSNGETLQDALNSGNTELRLVNSVSYVGVFTASAGFILRGGFDTCSDALNNIQGSTHSVLDGDFIGSTFTLSINDNYRFENIKIINGSANEGGGLNLTAIDMTLILDNVILENNQALNGAGIYKSGLNDNVNVTIVDSIIQNNTTFAGGFGGGIYFEGLGEVIVYGDTLIAENEADFGGGLYFQDTSATLVVGANPLVDSGIRNNKAREHGGAMYTNSAIVEISGGLKTIPGIGTTGLSGRNYIILGNLADSDSNNFGLGGGMFLYNLSQITLNAVSIVDNHAYDAGGGIYSYFGTEINIGFPENSNCQETILNGCNFFINNSALVGGALNGVTGTLSNLESVNFNGNRANQGTVASINGASTLNMFSIVMYNNGDSGNNGFSDDFSLGSFSSSALNIEHSTAVKNNNTDSFILASNGQNLLNSYNNYFYNPLSGPWLDTIGVPPVTIVKHDCQIVDDTNNSNDNTHYLVTTNTFFNDTQYFIDEANHDYHLKNTAGLIDFVGTDCPINENLLNSNRDMDNQPRTIFADIGADENLFNDIIFVNGFENMNNFN